MNYFSKNARGKISEWHAEGCVSTRLFASLYRTLITTLPSGAAVGEVINRNIRYAEMALLIVERNLYGKDKDAVVSIKMNTLFSYFFISGLNCQRF